MVATANLERGLVSDQVTLAVHCCVPADSGFEKCTMALLLELEDRVPLGKMRLDSYYPREDEAWVEVRVRLEMTIAQLGEDFMRDCYEPMHLTMMGWAVALGGRAGMVKHDDASVIEHLAAARALRAKGGD